MEKIKNKLFNGINKVLLISLGFFLVFIVMWIGVEIAVIFDEGIFLNHYFSIFGSIFIAIILFELLSLMITVGKKDPFQRKNAIRLHVVSGCLFCFSILAFAYDYFLYGTFTLLTIANTPDEFGLHIRSMGLVLFLMSLIVFVIAELFKTASKIKEENDLTV